MERKKCVITGGAMGIGRALVISLAKEGNNVYFVDKEKEAGETTQAEALKYGGEVVFVCADIGEKTGLDELVKTVLADGRKIDVLIHNAYQTQNGILSGCGYEQFMSVMAVNACAPYYLALCFAKHFAPGASIVNISSTRATMSQADSESYAASKGAVSALTHALAASFSGKVRVNAVAPGWIDTGKSFDKDEKGDHSLADREQHFSGRVGKIKDIVNAVLFLCDEKNSFIDAQTITVDGGMSKRMIYHGDEGWTYQPK